MSDLHPLAKAVSHPSPLRGSIPRWRVIAGLLLAPLAYSLQVVGSYVVAANQCSPGRHANSVPVVINLIALAAIVVGLLIAIGNFRRTRREAPGNHGETQDIGEGRSRFLAYCGLCSSGIFALAVIIQLTSILLLHQCLGLPALP